MSVSMQAIKDLRTQTGLGVQECKRALEQADNDGEKALAALQASTGLKAQKLTANRTTSTGVVASANNVIVELRCETDFVAKSDGFVRFAQYVAETAATAVTPTGVSLSDRLANEVEELASRSGEKIEIGQVGQVGGDACAYLHRSATDLPPVGGVLVSYSGDLATARMAAQQIYATDPQSITALMGQAWLRNESQTVAEALGATKIHEYVRIQA